MALTFNGSSNYISRSDSALTDEPITISCWFKTSDLTNSQTIVSLGNNGANGMFQVVASGAIAGDPFRVNKQSDAAQSAVADSTISYSATDWNHGVATFTNDTNRSAYLNGGNSGSDTTNIADPTVDFVTIGVLRRSATVQFFSGSIAEVAIWSSVLSTDEILSLSKGANPIRIGNGTLFGYWPLRSVADTGIDYSGNGRNLTLNGPTLVQADHPPVRPLSPYLSGWRGNFTVAGGAPVLINNALAFSVGATLVGIAAEAFDNLISFAVGEAFTGTVIKGNLSLQNRIASAIGATLSGNTILGNAQVTNKVASAIGDTLTGNVGAGDILITNEVIFALAETVTGNIIKGLIAVNNKNISGVAATQLGEVILGSALLADEVAESRGDTRTKVILIDGVPIQFGDGRSGSGMQMWRRARMGSY